MNLNNYLSYLAVLSQVQEAGHYVNEEIKEVIREIRRELGLLKIKEENLKKSQFLIFEGQLGEKATLVQVALFEATFGDYEDSHRVFFAPDQQVDIAKACKVLDGMSDKKFVVHHTMGAVEICS